ncbi:MAG: hypothetical protein AAGF45_06090 [Pseudomonadota bacterium]
MDAQVVILGYHRSGTSAATQHLARSGLFVGDLLLGANASNPHGHFEDRAFVKVHEAIFRENGTHWLAPEPFVPAISQDLRQSVREIVADRTAHHGTWGFKDPRACLFVDFWRSVLPAPRFLVCLRHYEACIDSIARRAIAAIRTTPERADAALQMRLASDHDAIARSWVCHMLPLLRLMQRHSDIVHAVDIAELGGSLASDLNQRFNLDLEPIPLSDTFDPALYSASPQTRVALSAPVKATAQKVWAALTRARRDQSALRAAA